MSAPSSNTPATAPPTVTVATAATQNKAVATASAMAAAASPVPLPLAPKTAEEEEELLRRELRAAMQKLQSREPLDPKYKRLLMNGIVTPRRPVLPKDKFYSRSFFGSHNLRNRVESYVDQNRGKDPWDRIAQRRPLEETALRAALTLRDAKEHEQTALLEATLAAAKQQQRGGVGGGVRIVDDAARKRHLEGVALFLQSNKRPVTSSGTAMSSSGGVSGSGGLGGRTKTPPPLPGATMTTTALAAEQTERARQQAELEGQREQARSWELARKRRDEEERQQRVEEMERRKNKDVETPQQALHKLYRPIFMKLWDMEFPHLGGINPFRIVIDRDNCASVGAPDYFDVIETPMNLTYIQHKVESMEYDSLAAFFADVDLMIQNALLYNSDPSNLYHIAAQEMKKRYLKIVKKVLQTIQTKK